MSPKRSTVLRYVSYVLGCLFVGCLMGGTILYCSWTGGGRSADQFRQGHVDAIKSMLAWKVQLEAYKKTNGSYPVKLTDVIPPAPTEGGEPITGIDPWGRPYLYQLQPGGYTLKSLGRDGKPRGDGLNEDLLLAVPYPEEPTVDEVGPPAFGAPTLWQFAFDSPTSGIWISAWASGGLTFLACLLYIEPHSMIFRRSPIRLVITLLFCFGVGVAASLAHLVPKGHH